MAKRRKVNQAAAHRKFAATAKKTNVLNTKTVPRGGKRI